MHAAPVQRNACSAPRIQLAQESIVIPHFPEFRGMLEKQLCVFIIVDV